MEALAKKYPDDVEAKIFHALALNETFDHKNDGAADQGDRDPGAARQEISRSSRHHALPHPQLRLRADRASAGSRRRTSTRRSRRRRRTRSTCPRTSTRWSACGRVDRVQSGARSQWPTSTPRRASSTACSPACRTPTISWQYAYLQLGQDAKAKALIEESAAIKKVIGPVWRATRRAPPCRRATMLERQDWQGAAQLQPLGLAIPAGRGHHALRARAWARRAAATSPPRRPTSPS